MNKIDFKKLKDSILDTIFLKLEYMSGDADAFEYEHVSLGKHIKFSNYTEHLKEIEKVVEKYKLISRFTGDKKDNVTNTYEYIKNNYSEELADLYDNVPEDSTSDGQVNARLSEIILCGYNEVGEYFESYV